MRRPEVLTLLLCRQAVLGPETANHSLVEVLNGLALPEFPATSTLTVYVQLASVTRSVALDVELGCEPPSDPALRARLTLEVPAEAPEPPPVLGVASPLTPITFARPGRYELRLSSDGEPLATRPFFVTRSDARVQEKPIA